MATADNKSTPAVSVAELPSNEVGATIDRKRARHLLTEKPSQDTMASVNSPLVSAADCEKNAALHGVVSVDSMRRQSNVSEPELAHLNPYITDVEAGRDTTSTERADGRNRDCRDTQVWPGQDHWKKKAKEAKIQRSCTCLSRLDKRTRLIIKIVIGLLIVGMAVGIGIGVSKPLKVGVWSERR